MGVDADDDRVTGVPDRAVESDRSGALGIVDGLDARIGLRHAGDDRVRVVGRGAEGEDDLLLAVVVLGEDGRDRLPDVLGFVEHGHDVGDSGLLRQRGKPSGVRGVRTFGTPPIFPYGHSAPRAGRAQPSRDEKLGIPHTQIRRCARRQTERPLP